MVWILPSNHIAITILSLFTLMNFFEVLFESLLGTVAGIQKWQEHIRFSWKQADPLPYKCLQGFWKCTVCVAQKCIRCSWKQVDALTVHMLTGSSICVAQKCIRCSWKQVDALTVHMLTGSSICVAQKCIRCSWKQVDALTVHMLTGSSICVVQKQQEQTRCSRKWVDLLLCPYLQEFLW